MPRWTWESVGQTQHTIDPDHEIWSKARRVLHDQIVSGRYGAAFGVPCQRRAVVAGGFDGLTPMESADLVHEESSHVAKRLARRAQADGKNVIWDFTLAKADSAERRVESLRAAGYAQVDAVFVDISIEVSIRRADSRHRDGHDAHRAGIGHGGRFVGAEMIRALANETWGSRNRANFEEIKHCFDAWSIYDNSADGRAPILSASHVRARDVARSRSE